MHLVCREGRFADLIDDLSAHRLDLLISDRALPPGGAVRGHTHLLGSSSVTMLAHPDVCRRWEGAFPVCLNGAPFLMPGADAALHSQLKAWFDVHGLRPIVVGEFDDGALLASFAGAGAGFMAAPTVLAGALCAQYGLEQGGVIDAIVEQIYAVTAERQVHHPALRRILERCANAFAR